MCFEFVDKNVFRNLDIILFEQCFLVPISVLENDRKLLFCLRTLIFNRIDSFVKETSKSKKQVRGDFIFKISLIKSHPCCQNYEKI